MLELFNNGDNDGTINFIAIDNTVIKCHEFVFRSISAFGEAKINFESNQKQNNHNIELKYSAKIIRFAVSKMYTDKFVFSDLKPKEIIELVLLMDELCVTNYNQIVSELNKLFKTKLTDKNWIKLLDIVYLHTLLQLLQ